MFSDSKIGNFFGLHFLLMLYSVSSVFSKMASSEMFFSFKFCLYYGMVILLLGLYAIGWQQAIKHMPLTTAFANKAVTVIWGIVWGMLIFKEHITLGKSIGAILIIIGIVIFAKEEREVQK